MLSSIDSQMGAMKSQQTHIQISDVNQTRLITELEKLVGNLEMDPEQKRALREADLDKKAGITAVIEAADQLSQAMSIEFPVGLDKIQAVVEKQKEFQELRKKFSKRLEDHLVEKFDKLRDSVAESTDENGRLKLPRHHKRQASLLVYRPLIKWLQINDRTAYMSLIASYTESMKTVYRREICQFRELAEKRFEEQMNRKKEESNLRKDKKHSGSTSHLGSTRSLSKSKFGGSISKLSKSTMSLTKKAKKFGSTMSIGGGKKNKMGSMTSINSGSINIGMDLSEEERKKFSDTMREMLAEMEPVCQEEQSFIINFFHLTEKVAQEKCAIILNII